ncbi:YeeE/YedE family protein [Methylotenera sp. G11]|uniref:YeeE/YedE family protein n=1 Tax=Methylotenera sp. G11 TaxID=1506585 RepID=UPI000645767A|nr:YeeE/YedE family protein [Methylotenera sp. G11]
MEDFTPIASLIGGILIGLSASMMILLNGRIAGVSGILGGIADAHKSDVPWRMAFLAGLVLSPFAYMLFSQPFAAKLAVPDLQIIIAGLLVGIGSRYGSGCTSGHGVCGIARMSRRSIIATAVFMAAGIATVYITHHMG